MGGTRRMTTTIAVGQTITRTSYVVLRGLSVRGWAQLMTSPGQGKPTTLQTPLIHIHPAPAAGPVVQLRTGPSISAHLIPVAAGGPLLYSEYASCRTPEPNQPLTVSATFSRWYRASKTVLYPFHRSCSSLLEWMLFVAQPGRPIARVYYCAQHNRCIYALPPLKNWAWLAAKWTSSEPWLEVTCRLPRPATRLASALCSPRA